MTAELHIRSAFSFLQGASSPEEIATEAARLGLTTIALTDRDNLTGAPRFLKAARSAGLRAITGAELTMEDGSVIPVLAASLTGYRNLCRLLTQTKLRGPRLSATTRWNDLPEFSEGLVALTGDADGPVRRALAAGQPQQARKAATQLIHAFGPHSVYVELQRHLHRHEPHELKTLSDLAAALGLPLMASNGVTHATRQRRPLMDILTCTRLHTHLDAAGQFLSANSERCLKSPHALQSLFAAFPQALHGSTELAERLSFSLENPGYEFPSYPVPEGESPDSFLRRITMAGARSRYGHMGRRHHQQIEHELTVIARLGFSAYFLLVWDIVNFCTSRGILVQGRGSAANSVVCYALGITACDPIACQLLFERFLSEGRTSWPDIDLDLPSGERREEVIQEVYRRWGPHGAAMTANVITFRGRSAMRTLGAALNFPPDVLDRFSRLSGHGDFPHTLELKEQILKAGIPADHPRLPAALALYPQIHGLPRHLGQHSGGMIICQGKLSSVVPLEPAAMPGRVIAQWDKDDCADLGIIKVDLLGLGMMAALQDTLELCHDRHRPVDLAAIPKDDPATYQLMQRADTIGVFQIESRAQMATLPRMKPATFYDVVVEVAIIRPGPIQGDMLHPYLQRRQGRAPVTYFDDRLQPVLARTLGVPLFQEQLLQIAMVMASFSAAEAEELRRALSFHRSPERMAAVCTKLRHGMAANHTSPEIIEQITHAVQSFAVYGFPESHAISFALLAYASCWLKVHRTQEFFCSLLNNQPMGFYSPATLVQDARRHGVKIRPVCIQQSDWRCRVDEDDSLRLGFCLLKGWPRSDCDRITEARRTQPFASLADFQLRTGLPRPRLRSLAAAGALAALTAHRRSAQWSVEVPRDPDDLFAWAEQQQPSPLNPMSQGERLAADYGATGLTLGPHPMKLLRPHLTGFTTAADLPHTPPHHRVRTAGLVICRQRPGTAKGIVFLSLEDETGTANAIVYPDLYEKYRLLIAEEPFLEIEGSVQTTDGVTHLRAWKIRPLPTTTVAADLPPSHDFR
jgi:error-prone DNA polymerase